LSLIKLALKITHFNLEMNAEKERGAIIAADRGK